MCTANCFLEIPCSVIPRWTVITSHFLIFLLNIKPYICLFKDIITVYQCMTRRVKQVFCNMFPWPCRDCRVLNEVVILSVYSYAHDKDYIGSHCLLSVSYPRSIDKIPACWFVLTMPWCDACSIFNALFLNLSGTTIIFPCIEFFLSHGA